MPAANRTDTSSSRPSLSPRPSARLGERLRQLRVAAGMTQSELAGERFSKEYVSQIERGKTRPTDETIGWLASRLCVDTGFLSNGVSSEDRGRVEAALARAEALLGAGSFAEAATEFETARASTSATRVPELDVRAPRAHPHRRDPRGPQPPLRRAHARGRAVVPRRRAGRGAALARRLPLQALE